MKPHTSLIVAFVIGTAFDAVAVAAEPASCADFYESAQEERAAGHLKAAFSHLKGCVDSHCPKFIRDDCTRWMDQVESALPSVVFAVRRDGKDVANVSVSCDGERLMGSLDGKAVVVNPGPHEFSFQLADFSPIHRKMLIREGEQNRIVAVEFHSPSPAHSSQKDAIEAKLNLGTKPEKPKTVSQYLPYGLTAIGALGVAGFTVFALQATSRKSDLERSCSPYCQSSQVDEVKRRYQLADACLAVGLISAGVATYLFLTNHDSGTARPHDLTTAVGFTPRPSGDGGLVQIGQPF